MMVPAVAHANGGAPGAAEMPSGYAGLAALVRDCAASGARRHVAVLRADRLPKHLSRPHHHRLARAAMEPLLNTDRAAWHDLLGGAVAVSWRGDASGRLAATTAQLRYLLTDATQDTPALADVLRIFTLPQGGAGLLQLLSGFAPDTPDTPDTHKTRDNHKALGNVLETTSLAVLERHLATVDVARFARRAPVHRITAGRAMLAWERRFFSVTELAETLMPDASITAVPWLYRRLTRAMDRRALALLTDPAELASARPFSLDLNVDSVLSPEFLRFDAALPPALRGRVTLNLAPEDLAADVPAFCFARDFARVRGYRLLLRDITHELLGLWRLDRLAIDLIALRWHPALAAARLDHVQIGGADWVLTQTDDPAARAWGQAQGIGLFTALGTTGTA